MTDVAVFPVPTDGVAAVWARVVPFLEPAVARSNGRFALIDVLDALLKGQQVLWIASREDEILAAITTKIVEYPRCRAMAVDWIGGEAMLEWFELAHPKIVAHAKANGCSRLEAVGRKGWEKVNSRHGWTADFVGYSMEL